MNSTQSRGHAVPVQPARKRKSDLAAIAFALAILVLALDQLLKLFQ